MCRYLGPRHMAQSWAGGHNGKHVAPFFSMELCVVPLVTSSHNLLVIVGVKHSFYADENANGMSAVPTA